MLIYLLIIFFVYLIIYQFLHSSTKVGINNYSNYNNKDASGLSHKNAGNIQVLEGKIEKLEKVKEQVDKNTQHIEQLTKQVGENTKHQQAAAVHAIAAKKRLGGKSS
jgi:predicted PurR-regulated permease PerM